MGVVPIYAILRHLSKVLDFHSENLVACHLTFAVEIRHRFVLGDTDCNNHIGRGKQVYMYIYHAQYTHTELKSKCLQYRCKNVNRGCHTLEIRMNGT